MTEEIFFICVLLYSNKKMSDRSKSDLLHLIQKRISEDPILKRHLHLICVDNSYTKNILRRNSRLRIDSWPYFCIRRYDSVEKYEIERYEEVFGQVKKMAESF